MTSSKAPAITETAGELKGELTAPKIAVMVVAAAAPMSCVVGIIPLSFALGSGASTPAAFLIAGLVLLLFSVGYAAMSRRMSSASGFYQYIAKGLGKPPAVGAALVAVVAYNAVAMTCVAGVGYFGSILFDQWFGWNVNWSIISLVCVVLVGALGYREIDVAARVLVVLLAIEVSIILILDVAIVAHKGLHAFPMTILAPQHVFSTGSFALGMMFALLSYIGFESAALYGEESPDPRRTVPRATYLSVIAITVFYFLSTWIAVGAIGPDQVQTVANTQLVDTFFNLSDTYANSAVTKAMDVTYMTSMLAATLALHNAANRYLFTAGRERLLPSWVGASHPRFGTPSRARLVHSVVALVVVVIAVSSGLDPYLDVVTTMTGLGVLGVVLLQVAAAAAIGLYFWRTGERLVWTLASTAAAFVCLSAFVYLILKNFSTLTGLSSTFINSLPWVLLSIAVGGTIYGVWLRRSRPDVYAGIATSEVSGEPVDA
ncbi:APC family permease [Nocardioides maradonensis]